MIDGSTSNAESAIFRQRNSFILLVVNALSDKAGENGIRLVGEVRVARTPIHTTYHCEQLPIHVNLILSSLYDFLQFWL